MSLKLAFIDMVDQDHFSEHWLYSNNWKDKGSFLESMKKHNR